MRFQASGFFPLSCKEYRTAVNLLQDARPTLPPTGSWPANKSANIIIAWCNAPDLSPHARPWRAVPLQSREASPMQDICVPE